MNWGILALAIVIIIGVTTLYLKGFFQPFQTYRFRQFPRSDFNHFGITVATLSDSWITRGEITNFWVESAAIYQARLNAIRQAKHLIQFETYIMTPGHRADEFAEILTKKAQEGVKIALLADSHGAKSMPSSYWQQLKQAGIEVRQYNPFDWRNPLKNLRRNHRKLLIIDEKIALIGGAGISDLWDGTDKECRGEPWLDYEIGIEGDIIWRLKGVFWQHWLDAGGEADLKPVFLQQTPHHNTEILVTANENPSYQNSSIRALFQTLILGATERFWLASPYFLPNPNTIQLLIDAQQRGVEVKILTMGKTCDKPYVHKAAYERYDLLLKGGIPIYEYQPSMMHAKLVLIDNHWVSFGSANFDPRSFFQNDELNLSCKDNEQKLRQQVELFFLHAFRKSEIVTPKRWKKRKLRNRLIGRFWLLFYWQL